MTDTATIRLDSDALLGALAGFYGSDHIYQHPLYGLLFTEGVKYFLDQGGQDGAHWLMDIICTEIVEAAADGGQEFVVIRVVVSPSQEAQITADDGDGNVFWSRDIQYTDLQDGTWSFYLINNTLLLPSEY